MSIELQDVFKTLMNGEFIIMAIAALSIIITYIKAILEVMLYISAIFVAYKAIQALNVYIDKNSK